MVNNENFWAARLAWVAGAWKWWAKERTGASEGDTRGVRELPLPSRVSFSRTLYRPLGGGAKRYMTSCLLCNEWGRVVWLR